MQPSKEGGHSGVVSSSSLVQRRLQGSNTRKPAESLTESPAGAARTQQRAGASVDGPTPDSSGSAASGAQPAALNSVPRDPQASTHLAALDALRQLLKGRQGSTSGGPHQALHLAQP